VLDARQTSDLAVTENLIDTVPHDFTANPAKMERVPDIHIALDEKRQSLHRPHPVSLKRSMHCTMPGEFCSGKLKAAMEQ
jgi:hypothetical protein